MKIAVIGAGGVGGYFGAQLAAAGTDVTFIARGAHLEAMKSSGLVVESEHWPALVHPVRATSDPSSVGPVDLVLVAVKLWSTEEAARTAAPLVGPDTGVVSLQNGVDAEELLSREIGADHLMGGVAYIAAVIQRPGVIRHNGTMAKLVFGELDGSRSGRAEALLSACERAGVEAELTSNVRRTIWEKFVFLVGLSAMTTAARLPIGPIRSDPLTRGVLEGVMAEAAAVAEGVSLPQDVVGSRMTLVDGLPAGMGSSMLEDLRRGNRLELDWLSGAVVRRGERSGIETPLNRALYASLKLHAEGVVGISPRDGAAAARTR